MVRVLHLLDKQADFQSRRCAAALARALEDDASIRVTSATLGPGADFRSAFSFAQAALRGNPAWQSSDLIHAWDERSLVAAILAGSRPLLFSPSVPPAGGSLRLIRAVMRWRSIHCVCPTAAMREKLLRHGVPPCHCETIVPGFELRELTFNSREVIRNALGFGQQDYVILASGESVRAAQHHIALWTVSILHVLDERYRLLVWGRGPRVRSLHELARKLHQPKVLIAAERELHRRVELDELLPAADLALCTDTEDAPRLPLVACKMAALPIVSIAVCSSPESVVNARRAPRSSRATPRVLAGRILQLSRDSEASRRLGQSAASEARDSYSIARYVAEYRTLYQGLATG